MPLTHRGRIRKALEEPFPQGSRDYLSSSMKHWTLLSEPERATMEDLIRIMIADKDWEAVNGFSLTESMKVLIAASASLVILGLGYDYYHEVRSIIVSPSNAVLPGERVVGTGVYSSEGFHFSGLSTRTGEVIVAWDVLQRQAKTPERGGNVAYHEFAHKLDELGEVDGAPPLDGKQLADRWSVICNREYDRLRSGIGSDLIDPYAATNVAEFFAVITETFFCKPMRLQAEKSDLYDVLRDFYHQDPAAREMGIHVDGRSWRSDTA